MENKLKRLFDYQRFEQNGSLERLIAETENRCARALSDEELSSVSAAGEFAVNPGTIGGNAVTEGGPETLPGRK